VKRLLACSVLLSLVSAPATAQNATKGANSYKLICQACHSMAPGEKKPMGPNLLGIFGRKAGIDDFKYSDAMKASGLTWDAKTIDAYLAAPGKVVPGGLMSISISDGKQRADIIAFLKSAKK